jgi:hypothetical protein
MNKRVSLVVLCEDPQHASFANAFLKRAHLPVRGAPRFIAAGSKARVIAQFPEQARAIVQSGAEAHLFVLVDADGDTREQNERALLDRLDIDLRTRLETTGRFLLICPNWEIENWIACIDGRTVTEDRDPSLRLKHASDCRPTARHLADECQQDRAIPHALPSLLETCLRWKQYLKDHEL